MGVIALFPIQRWHAEALPDAPSGAGDGSNIWSTHSEQGRRDHLEIEANVQDNQFHESARVHECPEGRCLTPPQASEAGRHDGSPKFASGRHQDDKAAEHPLVHAGHQINPRPQ